MSTAVLAPPLMLIFGTATVVINKVVFSTPGITESGEQEKFSKPWFQTTAMFCGMAGCLVVYWIKCLMAGSRTGEKSPLLAKTATPSLRWEAYFMILIPVCCDLSATALMNIGLQWIPGSVWQMLRGSMVVFSAILSVLFLGRRLMPFQWFAILLVTISLGVVGSACLLQPPPPGQVAMDPTYELYGVLLVVGAQVIQASQLIVEEFLLKSVKADPLFIVGLEGCWGVLLMTTIFLPIFQNTDPGVFHEDTSESLFMFTHTPSIMGINFTYALAILIYNAMGMMVTQHFTAVHRTILDAMRTMCVWGVNLTIFYLITPNFGERWTSWSLLQLAGFGLLFYAMLTYNQIIEVPGFFYPHELPVSDIPAKDRKSSHLQARVMSPFASPKV